jgi:serine protease DegQ
MRAKTGWLGLFLAAVSGGLVAQWLGQRPDDAATNVAADTRAERALDLVVPNVQAQMPARVGGSAMPSLAPMLQKVTPAVVSVYNRKNYRDFWSQRSGQVVQGMGSGVIVDAQRGLILTNHHVIEDADAVTVNLADGRTVNAEFIGSDQDTDIAVIRINADNLTAVPLADSSKLQVGDFVVAVGNPFGLGQTVTSGIVSAMGRNLGGAGGFQDFIQTDASINPGNSGGALVNLNGELVGINAASFNPRGSAAGNIGLGFAIPTQLAREVMRQLMAYGEVRRGSLGLVARDAPSPQGLSNGALVVRTYPGQSADQAGIRAGDVIVSANGQRINDAASLHNAEGLMPVGKPVPVDVMRENAKRTVNVVLNAQAKEIEGASIDQRLTGASFAELPERYRGQGISGSVVTKVARGSRAEKNGLAAGDVVLGIGGRAVADLTDFRTQLSKPPARLVLNLRRGYRQGNLEFR